MDLMCRESIVGVKPKRLKSETILQALDQRPEDAMAELRMHHHLDELIRRLNENLVLVEHF